MRKRTSPIFLLATALAMCATHAQAEPLQIKGRQLGHSTETACQGASEPVKNLDDLVAELKPNYPALKEINSTSCEVTIETFAGQPIAGPVQMLFLHDRLIQLQFSMASMDWGQAGDFYTAVEKSYGKTTPFVHDKKTGYTTRIWKQGANTLTLSRPKSREIEWMDINVVLRDTKGYEAFTKAHTENTAIMQRADAKRSVNDTK